MAAKSKNSSKNCEQTLFGRIGGLLYLPRSDNYVLFYLQRFGGMF